MKGVEGMIPYEQETVTSLYVKTNKKGILLLGIGVIGRRVINKIKERQECIGRKTLIIRNEKLKDFAFKLNSEFNVKVMLVLTNSAEVKNHRKFREIAEKCKELKIISMLYFAFEAHYHSKYPANEHGERFIDGITLEHIMQASSAHFNFTHLDYVDRSVDCPWDWLTPTKALIRDGIAIIDEINENDNAFFLSGDAIDKHEYFWDIDFNVYTEHEHTKYKLQQLDKKLKG